MKFLVFALLVASVSSCSFLHKRKEHYSYIKPGVKIEEVMSKSGAPEHESFDSGVTMLTYGYCPASYTKEVVAGLLTFSAYNWGCDLSLIKMNLFFKDGVLVKKDDNVNALERAQANREMAAALSDANASMERQRLQDRQLNQQQLLMQQQKNIRCRSSQQGDTVYTNCN